MTLLLFYIFCSVFISFACSLLEAVLLSVSQSYVTLKAKQGVPFGKLLKKQKEEIDRPLAAILTLNTIAHTIGAAGVGAQVHIVYGDQFVAVASAVLTFVILIFSEIIPKTLGATHWKKLAPAAAYTIRFLIWALYPIVFVSEKVSSLLGGESVHKLSREEMIMTAEIGATDGILKKKESNIIKNLLMLDNIFVNDIMTPRSVIMALQGEKTISEVMQEYRPIRYSRIPVFDESMDHITGVTHRYEILETSTKGMESKKISDIMKPIHAVPETISVSACLDQLIHRNDHIFVVVDEYGCTAGLVTLEDAIETLLGVEIVDEFDSVADLRAYALEQWKKRKKAAGMEVVTSS